MGKITAYVKSHPWMVGIIVIVGGLVFFMISGGGGSSSSAASGPSDAQIAADAQITAAQITAQQAAAAQSSNYSLQLSMAQIGAATQSEQAQLEAAVAQHALDVQLGLGGYQKDVALAQVDADKTVNVANIQAQQSIANTQAQAQLGAVKSTNKSNTIGKIIGGIGAIAGIFSDERLKTNIRRIGMHPLGFGIYEFDYITGAKNQIGYMAQEVLEIYPEAVSIHASGYYRVDYDLLEFERKAA